MVVLRVQLSLVMFVKLWQQTQTLIHLSMTIHLLKLHCILEVLLHFYKLLLLSFCGFLQILVLVKRASLINFVCRNASFHQGTCYQVQYCAKVMQVKCTNFVLCSRDFSMKVCLKFYGISSDNSLEQRAIFLRSFVQLKKICEHKR